MTFSRPINCHYYNGNLFVLGDVSRQSLYMIDRNKSLEKIPLSSPYHYLFGFDSNLVLINTEKKYAVILDTKSFKIHNKVEIKLNKDVKSIFSSENINRLIINYDPHLKLSLGFSEHSDNTLTVFQFNNQVCGNISHDKKKYVTFEYNENKKIYLCTTCQNNNIKTSEFKFNRSYKLGFRHPTSLVIKNDSFFILDSSNYSLKEYDISSIKLKNSMSGKGKLLGQFDRCNSMIQIDDGICLADMNNDRLLRFKNAEFSIIFERQSYKDNLNRPVSFSKSNRNKKRYLVSRDSNSIFLWNDRDWIYSGRIKDMANKSLIGYEKVNKNNYFLFRGYDSFGVYVSSQSLKETKQIQELLSVDGDIQDYDYNNGYLFILNTSFRCICKINLKDQSVFKFDIGINLSKNESLCKGISYNDRELIVVGFYTGLVRSFNLDGILMDSFLLPEAGDIFRKVIRLDSDIYLILSRKKVHLYSKSEDQYIHDFSDYEWSSPTDAIIYKDDLFITNKECDRVEVIKKYVRYCGPK